MNGIKLKIHLALRGYVRLARNEQFAKSELGNELEFIAPYSGRTIGTYPLLQINYTESPEVVGAIQKVWNKSYDDIFRACVFANPGQMANKVICSELRSFFDLDIPQFTNGIFDLPKYCDFIVPMRRGKLFEKARFYKIKDAEIKEVK